MYINSNVKYVYSVVIYCYYNRFIVQSSCYKCNSCYKMILCERIVYSCCNQIVFKCSMQVGKLSVNSVKDLLPLRYLTYNLVTS